MLIKDWGEDCAYSKNFVNWSAILYSQFTTVNKNFINMPTGSIQFLADPNISKTFLFLMLLMNQMNWI